MELKQRTDSGSDDSTCSASSDVRRMVFAFDDKGRQDEVRRIAARVKALEDALAAMHAHYRQWSIPAELFRQVESALGLPNDQGDSLRAGSGRRNTKDTL
jgi:hypothetical protein